MYRRLEDFKRAYANLTKGTQALMDRLENDGLDQRIAEGHRTLGQLAWHIVVTVPEMMSLTGLELSAVDHRSAPPQSADAISIAYRTVSEELLAAIQASWNDDSLLETDALYGESWARGQTLTALVHHEIHHRAQMTVLMRQGGLTVPGLFGPSKEEWAQFGMEEPSY